MDIASACKGYLKFQAIPITSVGVFISILSWLTKFDFFEPSWDLFSIFFNPLVILGLLAVSFFYINRYYKDRLHFNPKNRNPQFIYLSSMAIGLVASATPYFVNLIALFVYRIDQLNFVHLEEELWRVSIFTIGLTLLTGDMFRSMDGKSGFLFKLNRSGPGWMQILVSTCKELNAKQKALVIIIMILGIPTFYLTYQLHINFQSETWPNPGIFMARHSNILVDNTKFIFLLDQNPQSLLISYSPTFINNTKSGYVLFGIPYDGIIKSSTTQIYYEETEPLASIYIKYNCSKDSPCKISTPNGYEEIQLQLESNLDSKHGSHHLTQVKFTKTAYPEIIDLIYQKLKTDESHPEYGFIQRDGSAETLFILYADDEITNAQEAFKDAYYNPSTKASSKTIGWNLPNEETFIEFSFDRQSEKLEESIWTILIIIVPILVGFLTFDKKLPKKLHISDSIETPAGHKKEISHYSRKIKNSIPDEIYGIRIIPDYFDDVAKFVMTNKNCWILGERGIGKSVLCKKLYEKLESQGKTVLLLRAEEILLAKDFEQIPIGKINIPLIDLVKKITAEKIEFFVIIDSVEGIGRNEEAYQKFVKVISSLQQDPFVHTIMTIRDSDYHIFPERYPPSLGEEYVLSGFTDTQIQDVLKQLNILDKISKNLYPILAKPFYLFLLAQIKKLGKMTDYSVITNNTLFFQHHFDIVIRKDEPSASGQQKIEILNEIVTKMFEQKNLKISKTNYTSDSYKKLLSTGVLIEDQYDVKFVHDMYFDFIITLQIVQEGLVSYLQKIGSEFFLKSTINFALGYLRNKDKTTYETSIESVFSSEQISEYWKLELLGFIAHLSDVSVTERTILETALNNDKSLRPRFLEYIRNNKNPIWVTYWIDTVFKQWSEGDDEAAKQALSEYLGVL